MTSYTPQRCSFREDGHDCDEPARYCIEWWGLDQHGKNPQIADERYACVSPRHLVALARHSQYGGYPDEINDERTGEAKPGLLWLVKQAMDGKLRERTLESMVRIADPAREQMELFRSDV